MTTDFHLSHHSIFLSRHPLLPIEVFRQWADAADKKQFVRDAVQNPAMRDALYLASPSLYERCQSWFGAAANADTDTDTDTAATGMNQAKQAAQKAAIEAEETKLYNALCKYLARAAFRCTPFGMFASVTLGHIDGKTDFTQIDTTPLLPRLRFDFAVQAKIIKWLLSDLDLRQKLNYQTNNSLSSHGKKIYFVEGIDSASRKQYQFNQVEREPYLDSLLNLASRQTPFEVLRTHLIEQTGADQDDANAYLHELIDSEILLPDLGIRITGPDSFTALAEKLDRIGERARIAPLEQLLAKSNAHNMDACHDQSNRAALLEEVYQAILDLKHVEIERKNLFQADSKRAANVTISPALCERIATAAQWLAQLSMRRMSFMDDFKRRFQERFEDKEVALDLLFNEEIGIPWPKASKPISDLLHGIDFPATHNSKNEIEWDAFDAMLFGKFEQALSRGEREIDIKAQDIKPVAAAKQNVPPLCGGIHVQATLFARETANPANPPEPSEATGATDSADGADAADAADAGIGVYIQSMGGRTGVEILGRFCDLDPDLTTHVKRIIATQDQDDEQRIHAEVVHLPQDRMVNIMARPVLSGYEIAWLGQGGIAPERQIPITDLVVRLEQDRFVLRSKRLQRQVIPRLTSAHNIFSNNLNLYQFLGCLSHQDQPRLNFAWSGVFHNARFLPRISIDGVIVEPMTWRLDKPALESLRSAQAGGMAALQDWRKQQQMPRFVSHDMADNVLPVDLDNELMVQMLLDEVGTQQRVELREALALNADFARSALGRHNMEVVIPFQVKRKEAATKAGQKAAAALAKDASDNPAPAPQNTPWNVAQSAAQSATRNTAQTAPQSPPAAIAGEPWLYIPGSRWLYFKIYCGHSQADELINHYLAPLMRRHLADGHIEQWFFIRYSDPEHHVRLRAWASTAQAGMALQVALSEVCKSALHDGFGWKVASDCYEREVARYGGLQALDACENLFHLDSELVVDFINTAPEQIPVARRWLFAVFCVGNLLDCFQLTLEQQIRIVGRMAASFRQEFNFGARQKVQLGAKYRSYRLQLDKLVFGRGEDEASRAERDAWLALIGKYQQRMRQAADKVRALADGNQAPDQAQDQAQSQTQSQTSAALEGIITSLIHMHCNRLFIANQRAHEVVFYDFLDRIYESRAASARNAKKG
jgi:thiopeptide-type bacteriocin biosynthesis protein